MSDQTLPRLYTELAAWWPVLSAPDDYIAEAEFYRQCMVNASAIPVRAVLELGSGGGNNASHLKEHFEMTLVDISPAMLRVSRNLNPECEHIHGDMRDVRLGRLFDAVFVHDAVSFMTTEEDLCRAVETAQAHCRPGGCVLFCPDVVRETFRAGTQHGGHDRMLRGLRYLEWTHEPGPNGTTYEVDFAYVLRDATGVRVEYDRHVLGLFSRATWLRLLAAAGLKASMETLRVAEGEYPTFVCRKPAGHGSAGATTMPTSVRSEPSG